MCGRYVLATPPDVLAERFRVDEVRIGDRRPDYNVTPRRDEPVVAERDDCRVLDALRWGLVPPWADDPSIGDRLVNARAETVARKPAYRAAFARRRCLVPADGFYEWQKVAGRGAKQPYYVHAADGQTLALAGLWESWRDPQDPDAPPLRTFVIITTDANSRLAPVHDRMPVVLDESAWDPWLDPEYPDLAALESLLTPAPEDALDLYPVSSRVNRPTSNDSDLIRPEPPPEDDRP